MNKKVIPLLSRICFRDNKYYNFKLKRKEYIIPDWITAAQLKFLEKSGYKLNNFKTFRHEVVLRRFLAIRENPKFTLQFATAMFLKSLTGEFTRGRQTLISYFYVKHLSKHRFTGKRICEICGLPLKESIDTTEKLFYYYSGYSWNENPLDFLIELEDSMKFDMPEVTENDKELLVRLLKFIESSQPSDTPQKLEKRIALSRILPLTNKNKRFGILQTLAECGILSNPFLTPKYERFVSFSESLQANRKFKGLDRSNIVLPFSAWKGKYGVNWDRYNEIFNQ